MIITPRDLAEKKAAVTQLESWISQLVLNLLKPDNRRKEQSLFTPTKAILELLGKLKNIKWDDSIVEQEYFYNHYYALLIECVIPNTLKVNYNDPNRSQIESMLENLIEVVFENELHTNDKRKIALWKKLAMETLKKEPDNIQPKTSQKTKHKKK